MASGNAPTLEDAIALALEAHRGQIDKAGQPYVLHPLRLMLRVDGDAARMAAVLHDVVEDSPITLDDLRCRGYHEEVIAAVDCLTHRPNEPYDAFVERAAANLIARRVKLADLEDNMDTCRLPDLTEKDHARLAKYLRAWKRLATAAD